MSKKGKCSGNETRQEKLAGPRQHGRADDLVVLLRADDDMVGQQRSGDEAGNAFDGGGDNFDHGLELVLAIARPLLAQIAYSGAFFPLSDSTGLSGRGAA